MTGRDIGTSVVLVLALAATLAVAGREYGCADLCEVRAKTEAGYVCGLRRFADNNFAYASFRGVPYAKPPIKERRFKELEELEKKSEPLDPCDVFNATDEGPICYQTDIFYKEIMNNREMSEDCIFANIHVPINALPSAEYIQRRPSIELEPPKQTAAESDKGSSSSGLPILVFIHGGGFAFGSGDSDLHGPEYLVSKNVVVITFNYRLNVFGFLSLNSSQVPGNAGLRDMITLLKWVKRNAQYFGGDPDNVTLGGQSAGAIAAHLLTLSDAAEGLFKRAIIMSGTAISPFYSPSAFYAQHLKKQLLDLLNINATHPDEIYQALIDVPAESLHEANRKLIEQIGFTTFIPTVESFFPEVGTPVLKADPEVLRPKEIPFLFGHTDSECETFRNRLQEFDIVQKSNDNPAIIIPPKVLVSLPLNLSYYVQKKIDRRYYNGTITVDGFVQSCTDGFFEYPLLKVVEQYRQTNAPVYVYKFTYQNDSNVLKKVGKLHYDGAGHVEDLTYVFKTNSVPDSVPSKIDGDKIKDFMTQLFANFMTCSKPICKAGGHATWPVASGNQYLYKDIHAPNDYQVRELSEKQQEILKFYDGLNTFE